MTQTWTRIEIRSPRVPDKSHPSIDVTMCRCIDAAWERSGRDDEVLEPDLRQAWNSIESDRQSALGAQR